MSDTPTPAAHVSQAAFARLLGVSRPAVSQWKSRGLIVLGEGGLVDVAASQALLAANRSPVMEAAADVGLPAGEPVPAVTVGILPRPAIRVEPGESAEEVVANIMASIGVQWNYNEARAMKESYLALLNQLEYDRESGSVVAAAEVAAAVGAEYAQVRTRILAIPAEHAPRIARLRTVTEVQDALLELLTEALEGLTRDAPDPA